MCHVGDNLRAWAETLAAGLARTSPVPVPGYDPDLLAEAKRCGLITKEAALWSLDRAATAWCEVVPEAIASGITLWHARRGEQRAADGARNNAHDALHHVWDVRRILASDASQRCTGPGGRTSIAEQASRAACAGAVACATRARTAGSRAAR